MYSIVTVFKVTMNNNLPKHYQVMSTENNLDKNDENDGKLEEEHHNLNSCANNKYDVQLYKMNAAKYFQNETLPTFYGFDELG